MSSQKEVNEKMRTILVDWLIQVHTRFHLLQETLYLTISIIDRFLAVSIEYFVPRNVVTLLWNKPESIFLKLEVTMRTLFTSEWHLCLGGFISNTFWLPSTCQMTANYFYIWELLYAEDWHEMSWLGFKSQSFGTCHTRHLMTKGNSVFCVLIAQAYIPRRQYFPRCGQLKVWCQGNTKVNAFPWFQSDKKCFF